MNVNINKNRKYRIAVIRGGEGIHSRRDRSLSAGSHLMLNSIGSEDIELQDIHIDEIGTWHRQGVESHMLATLPFYDHYIDTTKSLPRYKGLSHEVFRHQYRHKSDINRVLSMRDIPVPKYIALRYDINNKNDNNNYQKVLYSLWRTMHMPIVVSSDNKDWPSILSASYTEVLAHIEYLFDKKSDVHISQYIEGNTYTLTTLPDYRGEAYYVPLVHKVLKKKYTLLTTYAKDKVSLVRHDLDTSSLDNIVNIAKRAHNELGVDHPIQWDIALSRDGSVYICKVDPNPDFHPSSKFIKCLDSTGIKYRDVLKTYADKMQQL